MLLISSIIWFGCLFEMVLWGINRIYFGLEMRKLIFEFSLLSRGLRLISFYTVVYSNPIQFEPVHEISNNVVCATSKASDQPAHTRSLIRAFSSRLSII